MNQDRIKLYDSLDARIGNTPLVKYLDEVPLGTRIYLKLECDNPFGSHYDRVYAALFRHHEERGDIQPGDKVLETTSGSAGVSFAAIGRELGYDCHVAIPEGGEKAREDAILNYLSSRDRLILTSADKYISGFPSFLRRFLRENKDFYFLNHSMTKNGKCNEVSLGAMKRIAHEICKDLRKSNFLFVPAIGNGTSALGVGEKLKSQGVPVVGFESFQSAVAFDMMFPGEYEWQFGINPGTLSRHNLPGTSFQGIDFPHIRGAVEAVLEDVLVSDAKTDAEYGHRLDLPHWDEEELERFGRTTKAGVAVAKHLAKRFDQTNFVVIAYDKADRYDE